MTLTSFSSSPITSFGKLRFSNGNSTLRSNLLWSDQGRCWAVLFRRAWPVSFTSFLSHCRTTAKATAFYCFRCRRRLSRHLQNILFIMKRLWEQAYSRMRSPSPCLYLKLPWHLYPSFVAPTWPFRPNVFWRHFCCLLVKQQPEVIFRLVTTSCLRCLRQEEVKTLNFGNRYVHRYRYNHIWWSLKKKVLFHLPSWQAQKNIIITTVFGKYRKAEIPIGVTESQLGQGNVITWLIAALLAGFSVNYEFNSWQSTHHEEVPHVGAVCGCFR